MESGLPIVTGAFLCERVLIEKDEVVSAIRIFDRIQYLAPPAGVDPQLARLQLMYAVFLKRGDAEDRRHEAIIVLRSPSGKEAQATQEPIRVEFPADDADAGVNLQVQLNLLPSEEGLFWVELNLDGQTVVRTPLRLIRQELPTPE